VAEEVKKEESAAPQASAEKPAAKVTSAKPGAKTPALEPIEKGTIWMSRRNFMSVVT